MAWHCYFVFFNLCTMFHIPKVGEWEMHQYPTHHLLLYDYKYINTSAITKILFAFSLCFCFFHFRIRRNRLWLSRTSNNTICEYHIRYSFVTDISFRHAEIVGIKRKSFSFCHSTFMRRMGRSIRSNMKCTSTAIYPLL